MNSVATLLEELRALNIHVEPNGSNVTIDAPKGALTDDLVRRIQDSKEAILAEIGPEAEMTTGSEVTGKSPTNILSAWDTETATLVHWFIEEGQHRIPDEPFQLCPWIEVTNPNRFKESLLFDISLGPDFFTNRNGKLEEDLRMLKAKFTSTPHTETEE